jgi:hypothetical protein
MIPASAAFEERYRELRRLPISIVVGAQDQIVDVGQQSARLHRELPVSDLRLVPDLGHMVHYGAPGLADDAIEAVASVAPGGPPRTAAARTRTPRSYWCRRTSPLPSGRGSWRRCAMLIATES